MSNHHGDLTTLTKVKKTLSSPVISRARHTDSVGQGKTIPNLESSCSSWARGESMMLAVFTPPDINTNSLQQPCHCNYNDQHERSMLQKKLVLSFFQVLPVYNHSFLPSTPILGGCCRCLKLRPIQTKSLFSWSLPTGLVGIIFPHKYLTLDEITTS